MLAYNFEDIAYKTVPVNDGSAWHTFMGWILKLPGTEVKGLSGVNGRRATAYG